jgi:predicted MPP superfamily phosphohydrolase
VSLIVSSARYHLHRRPEQVTVCDSRVVDVAAELGGRPLGDGPFRWLIPFPGNEVFQIETSTKELRLPRLPPEWDGLSILHLSDWHFIGTIDRPYFEYASRLASETRADLIVFTGDLLDRQELAEWIAPTLGTLTASLGCWFILGNHDWYLDPDATRRMLSESGWQDVAGRVVTIEHRGARMEIGGTERPWMGAHPEFARNGAHRHTSPKRERGTGPSLTHNPSLALRTGDQVDVCGDVPTLRLLLSHTPDHLAWARGQYVDLMLSGHNHGGQVVLPIIGPVYSPSLSGCRYAGGAYYQVPTLLVVSRGLAGRHPLRLGCRPEMARLVLRRAGDS